ncbi:50S ribosomal protein L6 [candidate division WWE3 bacterium]|uniref:Large ribosomal subunit protein uL6 n=1 Tax=candidate division WWE3 bacterium TaxID=2053526 RepID=A0A7X9DK90_UNCKA|nr:50S ribosomal protein L6 [candidate division WWE3 bacterium]
MSRIGNKPIELPTGVTLTVEKNLVKVKGPKGELEYALRPEVKLKVEGNMVTVEQIIESRNTSAFMGLTRALINNMVNGVTTGYEKKLELVGVGYRAKQDSPTKMTMTLGFSHPVVIDTPKGVTLEVTDNVNILIKGIDKQLVGLVASKIRKLRKPEPYKGKGIKYEGEVIRRKQGKSGKV